MELNSKNPEDAKGLTDTPAIDAIETELDREKTLPISEESETAENHQPLATKGGPAAAPGGKKIAGFLGLVVISVGILSLGILKIKNSIESPFKLTSESETETSSPAPRVEADNLTALQNRDTDQDGLSDFDELYVHQTSPYLEDSDSDGYSDKEEIDSGHDPSCPKGQDCYGRTPENVGAQNFVPQESASPQLPEGFSSIEELRQALEAAGIPKETLDQIDDNSLIELYNQTITETGTNPFTQTEGGQTAGLDAETIDYINQFSPEEIRQLLIQSGVDETMLKQVDDETLMKMVAETLGQQ